MKNTRVVVTGGAGFIGSNLVWPLRDNNDVIVIDNLSTGKIENIRALIDVLCRNSLKSDILER